MMTVFRSLLSTAFVLAMVSPAHAQTPQDDTAFKPAPFNVSFDNSTQANRTPTAASSDMRMTEVAIKYSYSNFSSFSLNAGEVNVCFPVGDKHRQKGIMNPCVVGEFDFGRADGQTGIQYYGGVRFLDSDNEKVTFFGEIDGGETHFSGENDFTMKFGGGVLFPMKDKKMKLTIQFFIPFVFFSGGHESGFQFGAGVSLPIGG
jgi:hypothetical protein